jgi:hypothetical protein
MDKRARLLCVAVTAAVLAVTAAGNGCSPKNDSSGDAVSYLQKSPLEKECERELLRLDGLIESHGESPGNSAADVAEAVELRRIAVELFLEEQYDLALELIEEAIALLAPRS